MSWQRKICRKAIKEISNSDPNIQVLLAVSLIRQGRSGSAVKRLKHTLRAFPDFPPAHEELGNALLAQNKPENAIEAFKKVLQLKPDNAGAMIKLGKYINNLEEMMRPMNFINLHSHLSQQKNVLQQLHKHSQGGNRKS